MGSRDAPWLPGEERTARHVCSRPSPPFLLLLSPLLPAAHVLGDDRGWRRVAGRRRCYTCCGSAPVSPPPVTGGAVWARDLCGRPPALPALHCTPAYRGQCWPAAPLTSRVLPRRRKAGTSREGTVEGSAGRESRRTTWRAVCAAINVVPAALEAAARRIATRLLCTWLAACVDTKLVRVGAGVLYSFSGLFFICFLPATLILSGASSLLPQIRLWGRWVGWK